MVAENYDQSLKKIMLRVLNISVAHTVQYRETLLYFIIGVLESMKENNIYT